MFGREVPSPVERIFSGSYLADYEEVSALPSKPYETSTRLLLGVDGGIRNGEVVLELGSGTGNSAIILVESNPNLGKLICLEPSRNFLAVAAYKFGKTKVRLPAEVTNSDIVLGYIESQRKRTERSRDKTDLVIARADNNLLPIRDNFIDRIYLSNVLHWLAYRDDGIVDINYLEGAFADFARVLKNGGRLAFNLSLQFDFGRESHDGKPFNSFQVVEHPFNIQFLRNVGNVLGRLTREGIIHIDLRQTPFADDEIDSKKVDATTRMIDWPFLAESLSRLGFEAVTFDGKPFKLDFIPIPKEDIADDILKAARMRLNSGEFARLEDDVKNNIISEAFNMTLASHGQTLEEDFKTVIASFLFVLSK